MTHRLNSARRTYLTSASALLALGLVGCAQTGLPQVQPEPESAPTGPYAQWGQVSPIPVWEPTVEIIAPTFTEEQALALREEKLQEFMTYSLHAPGVSPDVFDGINPADYPPEGWYSIAEHNERLAECLREEGFSAVVREGAQIFDPGVPITQVDALNVAVAICNLRYPLQPKLLANGPYSADQLGLLYDYTTQFYLPCLEAFALDWRSAVTSNPVLSELPTREAFIADQGQWLQPMLIDFMSPGERLDQIATICPRDPPTEDLYG